jgi:pantetheine-phosphate adenylyltransferase
MTTTPPPFAAKVALYAGSFDPFTHGHADIMRRSLAFADRIVVAVANNVNKRPLFSAEERVAFIRASAGTEVRIEVRAFDGLLVHLARDLGATMLVRGLRAVSDFEFEYQMALLNRHLHPGLETVFMVPSNDTTYISSSMVREVARFGGDVSALVHPVVAQALATRFAAGPV